MRVGLKTALLSSFEAHTDDKTSTMGSIGALYGLLIGLSPMLNSEDWLSVHAMIRRKFSDVDASAQSRKIDKIKVAGWRLHDATAKVLAGVL